MVDFLSGLLTTAGGAAEGTGKAIQNDALIKLKDEAMALREKRIADLRDRNWERADERQSARDDVTYDREQKGLLEQRAYDSPKAATGREIEGLEALGFSRETSVALKKASLTAATDKNKAALLKIITDAEAGYIKANTAEGAEITAETRQQARKALKEAAQLVGLNLKEIMEPGPGGGDVTFDSLDAATKEINSVGNPDVPGGATVAGVSAGGPLEEQDEPIYEDVSRTSVARGIEAEKKTTSPESIKRSAGKKLLEEERSKSSRSRWEHQVENAFRNSTAPDEPGKVMDFRKQKRTPLLQPENKIEPNEQPESPTESGLSPTWQEQIEHDVKIGGHSKYGIIIKIGDGEWKRPTTIQLSTIKKWFVEHPDQKDKLPLIG